MKKHRNLFPDGTPVRRVIDYATHEFFTKGVKQVTMDDIARGLQMSKRTLYQLFADKEQLIIACIEVINEKEKELVHSLLDEGHNVLEIILRIIEYRLKGIENISIKYIADIARYDSVQEYIKIAQEEGISRSQHIFEVGVRQGLFRSDVNVKILMQCLHIRMNNVASASMLAEHSIQECFITVALFHLRGCCTSKGIELIDKFLETYRSTPTS